MRTFPARSRRTERFHIITTFENRISPLYPRRRSSANRLSSVKSARLQTTNPNLPILLRGRRPERSIHTAKGWAGSGLSAQAEQAAETKRHRRRMDGYLPSVFDVDDTAEVYTLFNCTADAGLVRADVVDVDRGGAALRIRTQIGLAVQH